MSYVTDTPYADTFFRELAPAWLNYVAALNGVAPRPIDQPFSYLELGCGRGTSSVINAAAYPHASFHACDFNQAHVESARAYAAHLGVANLTVHADDFSRLRHVHLPRFDFIVLHGVYSWVDGDTREVLRDLIRRLLLPGGLAYVSYNALPGWSHELPLRKLLVELAATNEGSAAVRSERAAATINELSGAGLRYFTAHPAVKSAIEAYTRGAGDYLAHEFMNASWEPFYGIDVADEFGAIGLEPVGSAALVDNHPALTVDTKAADVIARLPSARQQQLVVDFATNQRFRRDVFVRADETPRNRRHLDAIVVGCTGEVDRIGLTAPVPRGEIRFQEPFIQDVRALMADGPATFADAVAALGSRGQDKAGIARNLMFLVASGRLAPFARATGSAKRPPSAIASSVIERALRDAADDPTGRRVVPSVTYGNGVDIEAADAKAVLEWAALPAATGAAVPAQLATFARLGLVA